MKKTTLNTDEKREAGCPRSGDWVKEFFRIADESHWDSRGWKWNREEIYDREVFRWGEGSSVERTTSG